MKAYKTNYTTRNGNGIVEIIKGEKSYLASFDGLTPIECVFHFNEKINNTCVNINLMDLHNVGFNAPAINKEAQIILPELTTPEGHMEMVNSFKENSKLGKWCGDGLWRAYEEINKMNYTEQVLAGEYKEY